MTGVETAHSESRRSGRRAGKCRDPPRTRSGPARQFDAVSLSRCRTAPRNALRARLLHSWPQSSAFPAKRAHSRATVCIGQQSIAYPLHGAPCSQSRSIRSHRANLTRVVENCHESDLGDDDVAEKNYACPVHCASTRQRHSSMRNVLCKNKNPNHVTQVHDATIPRPAPGQVKPTHARRALAIFDTELVLYVSVSSANSCFAQ